MTLLSEAEVDRVVGDELLDEARDMVAALELLLQQVRTNGLPRDEAARILRHDAYNLKLKARSESLPGLAPLTHRLDDYLSGLESIENDNIVDLQAYGDRISALLDGEEVTLEDVPKVVRELPHLNTFEVSDVTITDTEVMLVVPQRSAARVVERELANCGYRVSIVLEPLEALGLILETRPDLVITTMVMPRMSGVDLACCVAAIPATRTTPVALLTSLDRDHPDLAALPISAGLIRRGPHFGNDLAVILERFDIT